MLGNELCIMRDYEEWVKLTAFDCGGGGGKSEEADFSSFLFSTADSLSGFPPAESALLLGGCMASKFYMAQFPEDKAADFFVAFFSSGSVSRHIRSAFSLPSMKNTVIFECDDEDGVSSFFSSFAFSKIDVHSFLPHFVNCYYNRLTKKPHSICRLTRLPHRDQPVEVIDINFPKKKALIRAWPILKKPSFSYQVASPGPIDEDTIMETQMLHKEKRVFLSFDKSVYSDNGFLFRDMEYVDDFLIMKVDMCDLRTWSSSITPQEREQFSRPVSATSRLPQPYTAQQEEALLQYLKKLNVKAFMPSEICPLKKLELNAIVTIPEISVEIQNPIRKQNSFSLDSVRLYQLIRLTTGEYGVIIDFDSQNIKVIMYSNQIINLPINTSLILARNDNLARDINNKRLFVGDTVQIKKGKYSGCSAQILSTVKRAIFGMFDIDKTPQPLFCKSEDVEQLMDDEGFVLN